MTVSSGPRPATDATRAAQAAVATALPLDDPSDQALATRGFLAPPTSPQVLGVHGAPVWDLDQYSFLDHDCPDTVNPSLWRQARLNRNAGLYEVADGFYQVRGLDLSNITFIAGDRGWVVVDPLTTSETAAAALALANEVLGERPVTAVIYSHSHIDHFGGVLGVVDREAVERGDVPIYAPEGFMEAAVSENVSAGTVMTRRASYMYGPLLPRGPQGHVDAGIGKAIPILATNSLIPPTHTISTTGEEAILDGIRVEFQMVPDSEAPSEMNFAFPDHRILCIAENCTSTMHNLYTPRGAQVRDGLAWSKYIGEAIELFGDRTDVLFTCHNWPRWGADEIQRFLGNQRDVYRYLHDQTMRMANQGLTALEIAEELTLPTDLEQEFSNRGYYGTVSHNAKAIYQRYLGWFDANPAHLNPHPPAAVGERYVAAMGGADEVVRKAQVAYDEGDYRWVAEVVGHVVFSDPDQTDARQLQADAFEQLGYQAESAPWRDFYLTGAQELRNGPPPIPAGHGIAAEIIEAMTPAMACDYLGVRLDGPAAAGRTWAFTLEVEGEGSFALGITNGAVSVVPGRPAHEAEAI
ncbi:MAG: alkyl sulfatase dimerization domain-containing protein, partial [Aquihabitans sp.]